jgi:vacuolar-type H+-ATPase subunit H
MPDWGTLGPPAGVPEDPPPGSPWGNLADDPSGAAAASPAAAAGWGVLDGDVNGSAVGAYTPSHSRHVPPPRDPRVPPAEATASVLADGDVLWAQISHAGVSLGSGQPLLLEGGAPADQSGWCRVRVVDAARLVVRVLPVAWEEPRRGVGDDPRTLYRPEPLDGVAPARRVSPFPVGQGPDMRAMLEARLSAAEAAADRRVRTAEQEAQKRIELAAQSAKEQVRQAQAWAEKQAANARRELDQRLEAGSVAARQAQQQAQEQVKRQRMRVGICAVLAGLGWLVVLLLAMV